MCNRCLVNVLSTSYLKSCILAFCCPFTAAWFTALELLPSSPSPSLLFDQLVFRGVSSGAIMSPSCVRIKTTDTPKNRSQHEGITVNSNSAGDPCGLSMAPHLYSTTYFQPASTSCCHFKDFLNVLIIGSVDLLSLLCYLGRYNNKLTPAVLASHLATSLF